MKVYEGAILTCDANDQVVRYLVEDGGRILYVGDELPERYISVRHERLGKKVLIPAFTDSHIHFASFSTFHAGLNVMNAPVMTRFFRCCLILQRKVIKRC